MPRNFTPEKGSFEINGHRIDYELVRAKENSPVGIRGSRIVEMNLYRDGTLTVDYNRKWLRTPFVDDEVSELAIEKLVQKYGAESNRKERKRRA